MNMTNKRMRRRNKKIINYIKPLFKFKHINIINNLND